MEIIHTVADIFCGFACDVPPCDDRVELLVRMHDEVKEGVSVGNNTLVFRIFPSVPQQMKQERDRVSLHSIDYGAALYKLRRHTYEKRLGCACDAPLNCGRLVRGCITAAGKV